MSWEIKINAPTSDKVHVAGLGSVKPGEWIDLDDDGVRRLERAQRTKISKMKGGMIEVKKVTAKKKEDK